MTAETTIRMLAAGAIAADAREWHAKAARLAWSTEMLAAWRAAQQQMDDRCTEAVEQLSEADFQRLFDAEQAKVTAILTQIRAVIDEDRWPKHLYRSL